MVSQNDALALRPQGSRQALTLGFAQYNTPKLAVHGLGVTVEVRHVLVDHLQGLRKCRPRFASLAVAVTCGMYVWSRLVYGRVYQEARRIRWPGCVSTHHVSVVVDQYHVGWFQGCKVSAERIGPESVSI
jgi:hypothetical protein